MPDWLVAPYVGAWIETGVSSKSNPSKFVAPYVGAWIETGGGGNYTTSQLRSHPTWVRGLKLRKAIKLNVR